MPARDKSPPVDRRRLLNPLATRGMRAAPRARKTEGERSKQKPPINPLVPVRPYAVPPRGTEQERPQPPQTSLQLPQHTLHPSFAGFAKVTHTAAQPTHTDAAHTLAPPVSTDDANDRAGRPDESRDDPPSPCSAPLAAVLPRRRVRCAVWMPTPLNEEYEERNEGFVRASYYAPRRCSLLRSRAPAVRAPITDPRSSLTKRPAAKDSIGMDR